MKTFWILWHPEGKTPPTVVFDTEDKARKSAETMIQRIGHGTMYVMKGVAGVAVTAKTKWEIVK